MITDRDIDVFIASAKQTGGDIMIREMTRPGCEGRWEIDGDFDLAAAIEAVLVERMAG
ncbi:MAG: hypothetical protein IOB84_13585 [Brevundimonas sp.]|nr:hypothetical protein [Brevundimonas sp.]